MASPPPPSPTLSPSTSPIRAIPLRWMPPDSSFVSDFVGEDEYGMLAIVKGEGSNQKHGLCESGKTNSTLADLDEMTPEFKNEDTDGYPGMENMNHQLLHSEHFRMEATLGIRDKCIKVEVVGKNDDKVGERSMIDENKSIEDKPNYITTREELGPHVRWGPRRGVGDHRIVFHRRNEVLHQPPLPIVTSKKRTGGMRRRGRGRGGRFAGN